MKKSSRAKIFFDSVLRGPSLFSYLKNQSRRRGVFWLDYFCPPILSETVLPEWLFSFKRVGLCVVFLLFIIGLPLVATVFSNVLQVSYRQATGKKFFKIAPLHHHFEAIGWPSYKVTMRYWIISIICAIVGLAIAAIA